MKLWLCHRCLQHHHYVPDKDFRPLLPPPDLHMGSRAWAPGVPRLLCQSLDTLCLCACFILTGAETAPQTFDFQRGRGDEGWSPVLTKDFMRLFTAETVDGEEKSKGSISTSMNVMIRCWIETSGRWWIDVWMCQLLSARLRNEHLKPFHPDHLDESDMICLSGLSSVFRSQSV